MQVEMLGPELANAIDELKRRVRKTFPKAEFILFGSAARGELGQESDVDILVILANRPTSQDREAIVREVFEVNLRYGANISVLVVGRKDWDEGPLSVMPLKREVTREGVPL